MADNEASSAGMEEIKGHIGVLTARLKQLAAGGQESKAADALDDISDYYERAVQLRTYRITTLEEELKETQDKANQFSRVASKARINMWLSGVFVIIFSISCVFPDETIEVLASESTWTHLVVGLLVAVLVYFSKK